MTLKLWRTYKEQMQTNHSLFCCSVHMCPNIHYKTWFGVKFELIDNCCCSLLIKPTPLRLHSHILCPTTFFGLLLGPSPLFFFTGSSHILLSAFLHFIAFYFAFTTCSSQDDEDNHSPAQIHDGFGVFYQSLLGVEHWQHDHADGPDEPWGQKGTVEGSFWLFQSVVTRHRWQLIRPELPRSPLHLLYR